MTEQRRSISQHDNVCGWRVAIEHGHENAIEAAWNLVETAPTRRNLRFIIERLKSLRPQMAARLFKMNPQTVDLQAVLVYVPSYRNEAAQRLMQEDPSPETMCHIISYCPELRRVAWNDLIAMRPTASQLCHVMEESPELRDDAWDKCKHIAGPRHLARLHQTLPEMRERIDRFCAIQNIMLNPVYR